MFRKEELCEEILGKTAEKYGIGIVEMSVVPDHTHLIMDVPPTMSVSEAFRLLKGCSSHELFKENQISEKDTRKAISGAPVNSIGL